jgi:hypothetical protein
MFFKLLECDLLLDLELDFDFEFDFLLFDPGKLLEYLPPPSFFDLDLELDFLFLLLDLDAEWACFLFEFTSFI